ncbi:MAG: hypothetical protein H0X38_12570 [Planctomycetes bacterium]|nr:hypothetical protein [Planctomycetota bacterium]
MKLNHAVRRRDPLASATAAGAVLPVLLPGEGVVLSLDLAERTRERLRSVVTRLRVMQRGARRELRDVPHA